MLLKRKRVVISYNDLGLVDIVQHVAGNQFAGAVVAFDVTGQQDTQAIFRS